MSQLQPNSPLETESGQSGSYTIDVSGYGTGNSQSANIVVSSTEISSGPLPHPELLKKYDNIISGGAERIMQMAEREQENRFDGDRAKRKIASEEVKLIKRGQIMAFVLCLIFITTGTVLACLDFGAIAYTLLGIGMAPVIGLFYNVGKRK